MRLEEYIEELLKADTNLTDRLAKYNDQAAIFYQKNPYDDDPAWNSTTAYPRICFWITEKAAPKGIQTGTLKFQILCERNGTMPGEIEPIIRKILTDRIFLCKEGSPYSLIWSKTKNLKKTKRIPYEEMQVTGQKVHYKILELPCQKNTDPDPVCAVERYIENNIPQAIQLEEKAMADTILIEKDRPIFYVRLSGITKMEETNTVAWMNGEIAIHILAPGQEARVRWTAYLANMLSLGGEITMLDKSPMAIKELKVNTNEDYQSEGQILLTAQYGLLRYQEKKKKVMAIGMTNNL